MSITLTLSRAGYDTMKSKAREATIDGLYNDDMGFATFGVGHLVHGRSPCLLLPAAAGNSSWSKFILQIARGKKKPLSFLSRQAALHPNFSAFVAQVAALGNKQPVLEEARILALDPEALFRQDLVPYEAAVRNNVQVALLQSEYDPLVSLSFNIGPGSLAKSSLLKTINRAKYRTFDMSAPPGVAERRMAIATIEMQFGMFNKSGGKVLPGLTMRRRQEAHAFLAYSRQELADEKALLRRSGPVNACYEEPLMSWDNTDWEIGQYGIVPPGR